MEETLNFMKTSCNTSIGLPITTVKQSFDFALSIDDNDRKLSFRFVSDCSKKFILFAPTFCALQNNGSMMNNGNTFFLSSLRPFFASIRASDKAGLS